MKVQVSSITKTDKIVSEEETTVYKLILKGESGVGFAKVKMSVSLESESKDTIGEFCKLEMFEQRIVTLRPVNHVLGEFDDETE